MKVVNEKQDNIMFVSDAVRGNVYEIEGQKDNYFICAGWCIEEDYGSWLFDRKEEKGNGKFYPFYPFYGQISISRHKMFINIVYGDIYIVPETHRIKEVDAEVHIKE